MENDHNRSREKPKQMRRETKADKKGDTRLGEAK